MTTMNEYCAERLAHYRAITPHPGTTCRCGGLAEWREINPQGTPTPGTEWCYCSTCGRRMCGEVSPWALRADADWMGTAYMRRQCRMWRNERIHKRIKFSHQLGRRRMVFNNSNY